jgi:hypothetical protein
LGVDRSSGKKQKQQEKKFLFHENPRKRSVTRDGIGAKKFPFEVDFCGTIEGCLGKRKNGAGFRKIRVAIPRDDAAKWLFPQEKATSLTLAMVRSLGFCLKARAVGVDGGCDWHD